MEPSPNTTAAGEFGTRWTPLFSDLPREHGFEPLEVEGRLPADLAGTLYRVGPGLFSSFGRRYGHLFDGCLYPQLGQNGLKLILVNEKICLIHFG